MQQVLLLGELGERFGSKHEFENLRTPADAIRLFSINYPDFLPYLIESHENNIGYQIVQASTSLGEEDLFLPFGKKDLVITPVVMGSSDNPIINLVAAVALISIVVVTGGGAAAMWAGTASSGVTLGLSGFGVTAGTTLFSGASMLAMAGNVGILLGLSSISQILNPMPEPPAKRLSSGEAAATDGPQSVIRGAAGKQSYALTGPVNSVGLGTAVPIVYGEVITGSHILSVELEIESDDDEQSLFKVPSIDTIRFGSEKAEQGLKKIGGLYTANQTMFAPNNVWAGPTRWPYGASHGSSYNRVGGGSYYPLSENAGGPGLNIPINLDPADNIRQAVKAVEISNKHSNWWMRVESKDNSHYPAGRLQFLFSVSSLWRYISGVGSSVVDGFITYKVTVYNRHDNTEIGGFQASIQGLTMNQPYWWVHQVSVAKIEDKDWHYFKLEIVDSDVDSSIYLNNFYVRGWGYYIANAHWPHCDSRGYQFDKGDFGGPQYTDGPRACPA